MLTAVALLACAAAAQAGQRYATPTGSGIACTQQSPCSLNAALEKAEANDEVIVGGGQYTLPSTAAVPFGAEGAWVHGDFGGPPPTIAAAISGPTLAVTAPKSRLSYVDVRNTATGATGFYCGIEGTVERARATAVGTGSVGGVQLYSCSVRDSLILATGKGATAIYGSCETTTLHTRNVTAIATGENSAGVRVHNTNIMFLPPTKTCSLDLRNGIASGAESDLQTSGSPYGIANIDVSNSNFVTTKPASGSIGGPSNQTASPLFVNAAAGDYREAPGSPTIDAGAVDPLLGPVDLDGNPRTVGPAPDIGAFEYVPPPVPAAVVGRIQLLKLSRRRFRAANVGGATISAKKKRAPVGSRVAYSLSAAASARFTVERRTVGRRAGRKCVKRTRANRRKKRCVRFLKVKGGFSHLGAAGINRFKLSGRIRGKALKPGRYRLTGRAGGARRTASFRIVR